MLIFDIEDTIAPSRPPSPWLEPHEVCHFGGFATAIPNYVLEYLRGRTDLALLSTRRETAAQVSEAFGLKAQILLPAGREDIEGKFVTVLRTPDVVAWVDDGMSRRMRQGLQTRGVQAIKPRGGCITRSQLALLPH